ncbi:MAG: response regulator transcription factor [Steroidobacteraceae bacterium]
MRPRLVKNVSSVERRSVLTVRQQQVAALVQRGLSNKEIARKLRLSQGTVKLHVHNILARVGVCSRREIIVAATRLTA